MQHSLKLGGTNYHFKWVKVPGTAPYLKAWECYFLAIFILIYSYNSNITEKGKYE